MTKRTTATTTATSTSCIRSLFFLVLSLLAIGTQGLIYKKYKKSCLPSVCYHSFIYLFFYRDFTFNKDYGSVTYALFKVKKGANLTFEPTKMEFIYVNKYSQYAYNKFIFFQPSKTSSTSVFFLFRKNEWKNLNPCTNEESYAKRAYITHIFNSTDDVLSETILEDGSYYAVMSVCDVSDGPIEISSTTTFINPGNAKYLSMDVTKYFY